ncbi:hypothetical protein KC865_04965 [Candidatus Kaiserbacteria bacterium]|nr:hypothetical protein [Candidatus Kaiserbacteria bacterium]USN92240.1 MAG: hypothetical protein H6782_00225 [Candidatus Nomurabacteria bacterium]
MTKPTTYKELIGSIIDIINLIIPAIFAVLFIFFIWKMIDSWIIHAGDQTKRDEGKKYALTAVIVFVVMVSAWGIVALIKNSLFG